MKRKLTLSIISILALIFTLLGCSPKAVEEHINDPITVSGNLDYYANMDNDTIKEKCVEKHIEVTGEVSKKVTSTMIYLGTEQDDRYYFSCTFSESIADYATLEIGDIVTLHGVCTSFYESTKLINMYGCQIVSTEKIPIETTEIPTTTPTTESPTVPTTEITTEPSNAPTTEPTTTPTTEPTTTPTTEPTTTPTTEPPHTHSFSSATCTAPKTCSCGATEGNATGHNWKDATYTSPKTCTICGATEGNPLDVPGKENYHGHVYTGGESSKKYHYEAQCAGKNSHEITWEEVERRNLGPCGTCVLK